jgi:hypothetical protein
VDLYIHSPIRLHGVVLDFKHRENFTFFTLIRNEPTLTNYQQIRRDSCAASTDLRDNVPVKGWLQIPEQQFFLGLWQVSRVAPPPDRHEPSHRVEQLCLTGMNQSPPCGGRGGAARALRKFGGGGGFSWFTTINLHFLAWINIILREIHIKPDYVPKFKHKVPV